MQDLLRHIFGWVCGQNPGHTWRLGGELLPVCQRCTGMYAGAFVAALQHLWWRTATAPTPLWLNGTGANRGQECPRSGAPAPAWLWLNGAFLLFMVPSGFYWIPQNPELRCGSGILFGYGLVAFLWLTLPTRFATNEARGASGAVVQARVHSKSLIANMTVLCATLAVVPLLAEYGNAAAAVLLTATCVGGALALAALLLANGFLLLRWVVRRFSTVPKA